MEKLTLTLVREKVEERVKALQEKHKARHSDVTSFNEMLLDELSFLQDLVLTLSLELETKEQ